MSISNNDYNQMHKLPLRGTILPDFDHSQWDSIHFGSIRSHYTANVADGDLPTATTTLEEDEAWYRNPKKFFKVLLPHIALLVILLSYILVASLIIQSIEAGNDVAIRAERLQSIIGHYEITVNDTWSLHGNMLVSFDEWSRTVKSRLHELSEIHEGEAIPHNLSEIRTRWTFPSAVLYTLTIITTCGYDRVAVNTDSGKVFSVAFALIGIPLMFITAADIGKFLSESVKLLVNKLGRLCKHVKNKLQCRTSKLKSPVPANGGVQSKSPEKDEDPETTNEIVVDDVSYTSLWFPIGAYLGLVSAYCALGGVLYSTFEGWDFVRSFHFSFNTITTVGLGNVEVVNLGYLTLNVTYIIIGLAIVTMCIDLASTHLKAYFRTIHYFGRGHPLQGVSEEVKQMMKLIGAIRHRKGGKVTWDDLKNYMEMETLVQVMRAYCPSHISSWRYIDETSSGLSSLRSHASFSSDNHPVAWTTEASMKQPFLKAEESP